MEYGNNFYLTLNATQPIEAALINIILLWTKADTAASFFLQNDFALRERAEVIIPPCLHPVIVKSLLSAALWSVLCLL